MKLGFLPPILLLIVAAVIAFNDAGKLKLPSMKIHQKTPAKPKKDWVKINLCIERSAQILHDEAMEGHSQIDWDNVTPEESDAWAKVTSRLNMEKFDRDRNCRDKGSF